MTILDIVTPPNPVLRQSTEPVKRFDQELQQLIDDMIETMREANGVGLAAPQIGRSLRLAIIETLPEFDAEGQMIEGSRKLHVVANPEIVWHSRTVVDGIEGCLSIPGFVGEVARHDGIRVKAQDRHGKWFKLRLKDWTARIFQHEIDHLDGVLYIDRLTAPENFWREEEYYGSRDDQDEDEAITELV
jgi:peptide deformylase